MHPLLLFTLLFLPGILFVSCTLSVKKELDYPFLRQALLNGNFHSKRINPLMNIVLKGNRNYNDFIPNPGRNNGNVHRSVEYYTTIDKSTGKRIPHLVVQTIEYQRYNPKLIENNGMYETHDTIRGISPCCKFLASTPYTSEPQRSVSEKSKYCPYCKRLFDIERLNKAGHCPWCKSTINDQMPLKNDVNNSEHDRVTGAKRTKLPVSIIMLITGNVKRLGNEGDKKFPSDNINFDHSPLTGKHDSSIPELKNKFIDLLAKMIGKKVNFKEFEKNFDKINNIKNLEKNKLKKPQNNNDKNYDSVTFVDFKPKNKEQEKTQGTEEPLLYESKQKLSKTNFDASIIKTVPIGKMNGPKFESIYSVKMGIKPITQDKLPSKKLAIIGDNHLIGNNLDPYYEPNSLSPDTYKDNKLEENDFGNNKHWSRGVKRDLKPDQILFKNSDFKLGKTMEFDELRENEIDHEEPFINFKNYVPPKSLGQYHNIIPPAKVIPTPDEVKMSGEIPNNNEGNDADFKVLTSDVRYDSKAPPNENSVKPMSISLPERPQNQPMNVFEQTQLNNARSTLSDLPTSNPTQDEVSLNSSQNEEDERFISTNDNQTTTPDPHLEELSFWDQIKRSIMNQIAPLLNIST